MDEGLAIVCSTLGAFQDLGTGQDVYVKHEECLESLKDLQRYMRRDHPESRDVFMQLGKWNIVRGDIAPIIVRYSDDQELVLNCVKVLVFLTMPIDVASHLVSLQVEYLQQMRAALLDDETIPVIISIFEEALHHLERGAQKEEDWKMLQLFLTLLRNLLAIPDSFTHHISASTQYAFLKESLLEILFNESVMELVVALTQHAAGRHGGLRQDNFLMLEILHHILLGQRPEIVSAAAEKHFKVQKQSEKSSEALRALMHEEKAQLKSTRYDPALHTPYSGMFVRVVQDGTKTILTRTPHQSPLENLLRKPQIKRGPVKRVVSGSTAVRPINDNLQVLLKDFVNQFLASGYNVLMQTIKDDLRRESPSNEALDPVPFFQVVQFFTAYMCCIAQKDQENYKQSTGSTEIGESGTPSQKHICGLISSTLDEEMFVLVRSKWCHHIDEAQTTKNWCPVAAGLALMKDMVHMLDIVLKRPGPIDIEAALELRTARILLYKVFYDQTDTGILQTVIFLLKSFDIHKQPRSFLADLVEVTHIVLRMLEAATKEGTLRVLKKVRGGRKKAKAAIKKADEIVVGAPPDGKVELGTDTQQDEISRSLVTTAELGKEPAVIEGNGNVLADDGGASEGSQKAVVDIELTDNLTSGNSENWGENIAEVGRNSGSLIEGDYDDDDDDEPESLTKEVSLDINELVVKRFADNTIIRNYCWLLKYYSSISATTVYYVVRMLQRICEDRVLEPMLYQLSIFQTFYSILSDKQLCATEGHRYVVAFLTKLVRGFFKKLKSQPMLFIELLFWKLKHECAMISADYMIHNLKRAVHGSSGTRQRVNIADALGDDEDYVPHSRADNNNDGLSADSGNSDPSGDEGQLDSPSSSECNPLSESLDSQLKDLFLKYKDQLDYAQLISQELDPSTDNITPKQVKRKLRHLGLLERSVGKKSKRIRLPNGRESNHTRNLGTGETRKLKKRSVDSGDGAERSKRKKSNLFTESQDELLKELFLRHGNSRKCSRIIAEGFGGVLTPAQISRRLRTLGLVKPKPKSKLESFLANVRDCDEDGGSNQENVRVPNSSKKASSLDQSRDSEGDDDTGDDDDDDPLGSMFISAGFPGGASTSGNQDELHTNIDLSGPALRATIGRGARLNAHSSKSKDRVQFHDSDGSDNETLISLVAPRTRLSLPESTAKASTSKSVATESDHTIVGAPDESMRDNQISGEGGMRKDGSTTNSVGSLANLTDDHSSKASTGLNSEHSPSGPDTSWGSSVRKRTHTERQDEENGLLAGDNTADGLRASWGPNARRRSRGISPEPAIVEHVTYTPETEAHSQQLPSFTQSDSNGEQVNIDSTKLLEDMGNDAIPSGTRETSPPENQEPPDPRTIGQGLQRNMSRRRRLAKLLASSRVPEDEDQEVEVTKSSSQELAHREHDAVEESLMDDELNDF